MKKMLMIGFVFGNAYQYYIPMYIQSILRSYEDIDVCVYVDSKIIPEVETYTNKLRNNPRVRIIEDLKNSNKIYKKIDKHPAYQKAIRWLLYDDFFQEYEAVYIGDIDIFVCHETPGIFDQHMRHMEVLNAPYSNYRRHQIRVKNYRFVDKAKLIYRHGFKIAKEMWSEKPIQLDRLTGLHFVKTNDYYDKIKIAIPQMIEKLSGKGILPPDVQRRYVETDESILFDLVKMSGLKVLPVTPEQPVVDYHFSNCRSFRPHHGIHLGAFRHEYLMQREYQMISSDIYQEYYTQFEQLINTDDLLVQWKNNAPKEIQETINNIIDFYNRGELL